MSTSKIRRRESTRRYNEPKISKEKEHAEENEHTPKYNEQYDSICQTNISKEVPHKEKEHTYNTPNSFLNNSNKQMDSQ